MQVGDKYQHYKGNNYMIIALAKHTETLEDLVVYQDINKPEKTWVRPKSMFEEVIEKEGEEIFRFKKISGE